MRPRNSYTTNPGIRVNVSQPHLLYLAQNNRTFISHEAMQIRSPVHLKPILLVASCAYAENTPD